MTTSGQPLLVNSIARSHYTSLDGLRGCAILSVVAYHLALVYRDVYSHHPLLQIAQLGWLGVDLFFVLSGFLITGILIETRESPHYFRNFIMRRFLRIWPLYYLSLAAFFIAAPLLLHPMPEALRSMQEKQAWFWLYAANWLFAREGRFELTGGGYYWSLAVEEQFYLVWPAVVAFLSRKGILRLSLVLLGLSLGLRVVLLSLGSTPSTVYAMTITHLDSVVVGAAISVCLRDSVWSKTMVRMWPTVAMASLALLIVVRLRSRTGYFWDPGIARYTYTLAAILFGSLLVGALNLSPTHVVSRILGSRFLVASGRYSYALYLIHVPVTVAVEQVLLSRMVKTTSYAVAYGTFVAVSFTIAFVLSMLSWHLFEKHVNALKRYFA